jgi:hypothetical protein
MDDFRRRPPMEGFSRPGGLGGEAVDDDVVEGHIMDDRDRIGDTEYRRRVEDEDVEGHGLTKRSLTDDEDVEGHGLTKRSLTDDDDTEGHATTKRS